MKRPIHGGPDGRQPIEHDFSTNANPLGPPPGLDVVLAAAQRSRYPDPAYAALRRALAAWHGVAPERVMPTAGTSEAIRRLTLAARLRGVTEVWVPAPGYGDYAAAASALGLTLREYRAGCELLQGLGEAERPALVWICEPCNPTGDSLPAQFWRGLLAAMPRARCILALDRAYEPLRLQGTDPVPAPLAMQAWQCLSPNKALAIDRKSVV